MPTYNQPQNYLMFYPVKGEEGAKNYYVSAGQKALLIDSEDAVIYVKSTNALGQPLPLEIYDLVLRNPVQPAETVREFDMENEIDKRIKEALKHYFPQINFDS